ncbi:ABC transporter substrate-binding protein [uncultured Oceanicoccus sp.]|uniref:heme/hemin ABC transporter substrate-binding protein n=1 Tax=uncultured Oceanicoccus sp. TaxID=1706381 RepID=UPI0030DACC2C
MTISYLKKMLRPGHYGVLLLAALVISSPVVAQPQRIISTDAGVTEVLLALGVGNRIVGVDVTSAVPDKFSVKKLGYHRMLSAEGLLSLNPSLVVGSKHMGPPETVTAIQKANLQLVQLPVAKNEKNLKANIQAIGTLVGKETQTQQLLQSIDHKMAAVNNMQLTANTKVAFLLQMDGRGIRLAGKGTTGGDLIALLGGKNLGEHNGYQTVSSEALLGLKPDVIIVASRDSNQSSVETLLTNNTLLKHSPAAKQQKIIEVDGSALVAGISLPAIDALQVMAAQLQ